MGKINLVGEKFEVFLDKLSFISFKLKNGKIFPASKYINKFQNFENKW